MHEKNRIKSSKIRFNLKHQFSKMTKRASVLFVALAMLLSNFFGVNMFSSIFNIIEANAAPYPERVYSTTLLPASTISNLKLNITSLPTISHSGYHSVTVKEGNWTTPAGMTQYNIRLQFTNAANSARLDDTVTAMFTNCGTLNGRAIDMKLVYCHNR